MPRTDQNNAADSRPLTIKVDEHTRVSGLLLHPAGATTCYVLAHGAGAGMTHPFMQDLALGLAARRIATLRYQFPYMERHGKRPDPPALCHATVRAAVHAARRTVPALALVAGGKSFGGRMSSQAQALAPLDGVRGLIFLGFPLHPPKQPSAARAAHLDEVHVPLLFLQGARDAFAEAGWLDPLIERLGTRATRLTLPFADHSFHVPARSGRTDRQTLDEVLDAIAAWTGALPGSLPQ